MNRRGMVALEAVVASAQILLLAVVVTGMLTAFWQTWSGGTEAGRQRQWATVAFAYLDQDLRGAQEVIVSPTDIRIVHGNEEYAYRVTGDRSLYREIGGAYYALAIVDAANWWLEGNLLWIEISFPKGSYRACYFLGGSR